MTANLSGLPEHLRSNGYEGYIYAVEMSTGIVKVGKTRNPRGRIGTHINEAGRFGVAIANVWLSPRHQDWTANESRLIAALGAAEFGNEYFRVPFARAVELAESLEFQPLTEDERAEREAAAEASARALAESLWGADDLVAVPKRSHLIWLPLDDGITARALRDLFNDELPPALLESNSDEMPALLARLAELSGIDIEEIERWSHLEVMKYIACTGIEAQCHRRVVQAHRAKRFDLIAPVFNPEAVS